MGSLDTILNASRQSRRMLAAAVPASAILLVGAVVWLGIATLEDRSAELTRKREALGRLDAVLAMKPIIENAKDVDLDSDNLPEFLRGDSEAVIQAGLQTRLDAIAKAAKAEVVSVGPTPTVERRGMRMTGLRANITGTNQAIIQVVAAIEAAKPYLTIRTAEINSIDDRAADSGVKPRRLMLTVQFEGALPPGEKQIHPAGEKFK